MRTINVLLGNADRRLNNRIEAAVLDACHHHAAVCCTRAGRINEFAQYAMRGAFDLVIVAPGNLLPAPGRAGEVGFEEILQMLKRVTGQRRMPFLAVAAWKTQELDLLHAGVDQVLLHPVKEERLKGEVRRLLEVPELAAAEAAQSHWSIATLLLRGWQRLRSA